MSRWYQQGLHFECTRCGNCCKGEPGTVLVSDDEIAELAAATDLATHEFREVYTRTLGGGAVSLREKRSGGCVFFDPARGCSVYAARPRQCRSWPFWAGVLASAESWQSEAESCPGMGRGPLRSADEIDAIVRDDGTLSSEKARAKQRDSKHR
jgi:Fe-S-cluster containining protein